MLCCSKFEYQLHFSLDLEHGYGGLMHSPLTYPLFLLQLTTTFFNKKIDGRGIIKVPICFRVLMHKLFEKTITGDVHTRVNV